MLIELGIAAYKRLQTNEQLILLTASFPARDSWLQTGRTMVAGRWLLARIRPGPWIELEHQSLELAVNCIMSLVVLLATAGPATEVIAHRGESFDAPENTLAAFRLAWERKVKAIELDVHLTRDGQLVVSHDKDTKRTTGRELAIKDSQLDSLRVLDAGRWKGERWAGEKLPTLDECLATIPAGARCLIEIKVGPEAVPAVVTAVNGSGKRPDQLAIISFKAETIAEAKRQLPRIETYFLSSFKQDKATGAWSPSVDELIQQAKSVHADGLDLSYEGPVDREFVQRVKKAGLKFYVWTVDDPLIAQQFATWGADGITTNRAAWLAPQLSESTPKRAM